VAIDERGRLLPLEGVGTDELFGLHYYRLRDSVMSPIDTAQQGAVVGQSLLALDRTDASFSTAATPFTLEQTTLPKSSDPQAWQQLLVGPALQTKTGTPVIDDAGRLVGIVVDPAQGRVLPIHHVQQSISRIIEGKRELDPFVEAGLRLTWQFTAPQSESDIAFSARVASVRLGSPAVAAGVRQGDALTAINDTPLTWSTNVTELLASDKPVLTVQRGDQTLRLDLVRE